MRLLKLAFLLAVLAFVWLRFSENTADNDLWGHVLYGERNWLRHTLSPTETLSFTAAGAAWTNHEYLAELVFGFVHRAGGGTALWCMMILCAALTLSLAIYRHVRHDGTLRWTAIGALAASANSIALGYAVRPQLFTMLALVFELWVVRETLEGKRKWAFLLPPLFAVWVNTHGGYLAGALILAVATVSASAERLFRSEASKISTDSLKVLWGVSIGSAVALLINPNGFDLIAWTIKTIQLPRPYIPEWHQTPFTAPHALFWFLLASSALAWCTSREQRYGWQAAVLAVLALMACTQMRHQPLFGLANLMFSVPHLAELGRRLRPHCGSLITLIRRPVIQTATSFVLLLLSAIALHSSSSIPREHPFTIEVEKDVFPVAAIAFMKAHTLDGNTLVFFDWGQQVLWELPANPVSFDGRLDTVYSKSTMDAHWEFYSGERIRHELGADRADVALLPTECPGVFLLRQRGWKLLYRDSLASVLIPARGRHASRFEAFYTVVGGPAATLGREPFPREVPVLATPSAGR